VTEREREGEGERERERETTAGIPGGMYRKLEDSHGCFQKRGGPGGMSSTGRGRTAEILERVEWRRRRAREKRREKEGRGEKR